MQSIVSLIPHRTLVAIGKKLGGGSLGFDPNRTPGGKQGVATKLIAMHGEDAIIAAWRAETPDSAPPPSTATSPQGAAQPNDSDTQQDAAGDAQQPQDNSPAQDSGDAQDNSPAAQDGDTQPASEANEQDGGTQDGGTQDGDAPQGEQESNAAEQPAQDGSPADTQDDTQPQEQPAPDAPKQPGPPPPSGNPMDDHIRRIAREEDQPVTQWIGADLLPYLASIAARTKALEQRPAQTMQQPQGAQPGDGDSPHQYIPARVPQPATMPGNSQGAARPDKIQHKLFPKLVALLAQGMPVLLIGPAGTGKSHACAAAARHFGYTFADQSLSSGVSESALTGWLLPIGENGRFSYVASPFVTQYESGNSVFLFDEIDAASPDMLVILNSALANGRFTLPQRFDSPNVTKGANVLLVGAANTLNGADDMHSARQQIDGATLDRFYILHWPHDNALEDYLLGVPGRQRYWKAAQPDTSAASIQFAREWVRNVRDRVASAGIMRIFGTRAAVRYVQALAAGVPHAEIQADLLTAWSKDEIARLNEYAPGKTLPQPPQATPGNAQGSNNHA